MVIFHHGQTKNSIGALVNRNAVVGVIVGQANADDHPG